MHDHEDDETHTLVESQIFTAGIQKLFEGSVRELPRDQQMKAALGFVGGCISVVTQVCAGFENPNVTAPMANREDQIRIAELLMRTLTDNFPHLPQKTSVVRATDIN